MIRIGKPEIEAVTRVLESGNLFRYASDPNHPTEVDLFEKEWAELIGTKYALAVTNGTSALICALAGLGVGPGDEVIIPGYTFMATATAVVACGAIPILAEVDDTLLLDPQDLEKRLTPRTKAIIPVHMLGLVCDMDPIMAFAKKHNLFVIEDGCQADGASYKGRRVGSIGDVGAFSFNYYKVVSCGEGGAVTTNCEHIYDNALVMHDSGLTFRPAAGKIGIPTFIGSNFRLNNILGAILRAQLTQVDGWITSLHRVENAMRAQLSAAGVPLLRSNDPAGGIAGNVGVQFATEAETLRCMEALTIGYMRPFDTGRHVYSNWDPLLEHRVSYHPALNPFNWPANQASDTNYTADMLPRTLDILKRTLIFSLDPEMTETQIDARARAIISAVKSAVTAKDKVVVS